MIRLVGHPNYQSPVSIRYINYISGPRVQDPGCCCIAQKRTAVQKPSPNSRTLSLDFRLHLNLNILKSGDRGEEEGRVLRFIPIETEASWSILEKLCNSQVFTLSILHFHHLLPLCMANVEVFNLCYWDCYNYNGILNRGLLSISYNLNNGWRCCCLRGSLPPPP